MENASRTDGPGAPSGFEVHDHRRCIAEALRAADASCARLALRFTPVRRRVLEILLESHAALGAYDVLARLEHEGLGSQPPVAYRALGFLVEHGFVHRVERLNAFVACARPGVRHEPLLMICTGCGSVGESVIAPSRGVLERAARANGFRIERAVLEATGLCPGCARENA